MSAGNDNNERPSAAWPFPLPRSAAEQAEDTTADDSDAAAAPEATDGKLQILEAVSLITVPEDVIKASNIPALVKGLLEYKSKVSDKTQTLDGLRKEQAAHGSLSNWWNDRGDKIHDAQSDLNAAMGELSKRSSDLLIVNTVLAKILNDQQVALARAQLALKEQADGIAWQNAKIKEQQLIIEQNQAEIRLANQGLLEAKGLTQAQAQQLVGCVQRVKEAEGNILEAHGRLIEEVHGLIEKSAADCAEIVRRSLVQFDDAHLGSEQRMDGKLAERKAETQKEVGELSKKIDALLQAQNDMAAKSTAQGKALKTYRATTALAAVAGVGALAWLAALQFLHAAR